MPELPLMDWGLAVEVGRVCAPPGPQPSTVDRVAVIEDLHALADEAHGHAVEVSGLPDPGQRIGVRVLGRAAWIEANTESMQTMLAPLLPAGDPATAPLGTRVTSRAAALGAGAALAWVSTKIIGQFDPFASEPTLYFVAPNVLAIQRRMRVDPRDFRLWVAVHEQTHRLQFHRAPWLGELLPNLLTELIGSSLDSDAEGPSVQLGLQRYRGREKDLLEQATALMSVLEGHAEVMMDAVGPDVIPTVATIRRRFAGQRERGGIDALARRFLGLDVKMAQYRDGAAFCRAVLERSNRDTLNRVWESAETFPTNAELHEPDAWLARVG